MSPMPATTTIKVTVEMEAETSKLPAAGDGYFETPVEKAGQEFFDWLHEAAVVADAPAWLFTIDGFEVVP
jgi:hypothetical protein